jgi:hypothetical protein
MGLTATILENKKKNGLILRVLTGIGMIAGGNFLSYPLAICIKKSAKRIVYTVVIFELFAISCWRIFCYGI